MESILFLIIVIGLAAGILCVFIKQMDKALNFSMKKKIRVKKIPLYFPNDRKNESKLGETLENPNEGVYLPAFICSLITYLFVLLAIVFVVIDLIITLPQAVALGLIYGFVGLLCIYMIILNALLRHYIHKYYNNQEYWKSEIKKILAAREQKKQEETELN